MPLVWRYYDASENRGRIAVSKDRANFLSYLFIIATVAVAAWIYPSLPDPMPSHWNSAGEVDSHSPKPWGVMILPLSAIFVFIVFRLIPVISPKGFKTGEFADVLNVFQVVIVGFVSLVCILVMLESLGFDVRLNQTTAGPVTAQRRPEPVVAAGTRQVADQFAPHRAMIRRYLDSTNTASLSVAVAKDGKILWEEGFGWANREKMVPATPHTMYSLASISKPITATGLMVLVERGRVALDQPANQYLGVGKIRGLAGDATGATVRRVLSHTAGLPLHWQFFYADHSYGPPTMDETIARYGITVFPPGAQDMYSNLGYGILDHIISRVSGQTYADFMRNEVFLPLGLTRTSVDIGPGLAEFVAERYDLEQRPIPFYTFDHPGASAVYSSAHDVVRFGMFHLKQRLPEQRAILSPASIDEMHRPVAPANYGLGFSLTADDMGSPRFGHGGGMPGVSTVLALYPNEGVAIALLTNARSPVHPEYLVKEIMATLSPRFGDSLRARQGRSKPAPPAFAMPAGLLGEWTGTLQTWQQTLPMRLVAQPDGDIHVWVGDQPCAVVNELELEDGRLHGRFAGTIPTDDARRWAHDLRIDFVLGSGTLVGQVNAITTTAREMWALGSYAELRKR